MSVPFAASDAVRWTGGALAAGQPDVRFGGTGIDSRRVGPGELFVAIVGPKHDAHTFVPDVAAAGAAGALIVAGRVANRELPRAFAVG